MPETWRDVAGPGGVRLRVRIAGDDVAGAPTLLLHHGLASSQRIWDLMLPRLARRFRVVTYDARGHGVSAKPASGYGFPSVVEDAVAVIRATRSRRPIVVGHSWGAMVALEIAARRPRSVAGAVLVDGGVAPIGAGRGWTEVREALAPPRLAGMPLGAFRSMMPSFFDDALRVTPEIEAIVLAVMHVRRDGTIRPRLSRANHLRILRAIWEQDPLALHTNLRVPALAILARHSGVAPDPERHRVQRMAVRALAASQAPTRVAWMTGVHDLPLQHPDALARRIERFATSTVG
ncbi:MAG TPA: alpha/beta hydrolase [Actinomycetota bacterium]|nr:alpha/beta hydrolase [Actinomycetota bacterium]